MGVKPSDDYEVPWWFSIVQVAKFYGCHPEEVLKGSSFWIAAAQVTAEVEAHVAEVRQARSK